jgi:aspartate oxidase
MASREMPVRADDVIVVGSDVAGLVCALSMAPRSVTLITKTPQLERDEGRGAHYRDDYPTPRPEWRRAQSFAADALVE